MVNNNEEFIKENINKLTVKEILKEIKISKTTYYRFIKKIGINKTSESTYNNRTKANKKNGRDLSFENIKTLSEKYFFKKDFYYNETVAYETAKKRGWLNEICKGLVETTRSYPQILLKEMLDELLNVKGSFNNWLIIKPFEIDIYYEKFGLCFEYDGYYWHRNNKNDFLKNELIKEKGLSLIRICEPEGFNY